MKKSEYSSYDGLGIAKLIREKEVNVREVLDTAISIIETYDEDISAITTKAYDHAIKAIEKSQPENIFHGVPFLLKDLNVSCGAYQQHYQANYLKIILQKMIVT